ncbi:MAG: hypothetical protein Q9161_009228 [Pseudevernia consocians]
MVLRPFVRKYLPFLLKGDTSYQHRHSPLDGNGTNNGTCNAFDPTSANYSYQTKVSAGSGKHKTWLGKSITGKNRSGSEDTAVGDEDLEMGAMVGVAGGEEGKERTWPLKVQKSYAVQSARVPMSESKENIIDESGFNPMYAGIRGSTTAATLSVKDITHPEKRNCNDKEHLAAVNGIETPSKLPASQAPSQGKCETEMNAKYTHASYGTALPAGQMNTQRSGSQDLDLEDSTAGKTHEFDDVGNGVPGMSSFLSDSVGNLDSGSNFVLGSLPLDGVQTCELYLKNPDPLSTSSSPRPIASVAKDANNLRYL